MRCIDKEYVCDLEDNCRDGSDEIDCAKSSVDSCKSDEFRCQNGDCILGLWRCDGDQDCRGSLVLTVLYSSSILSSLCRQKR